MSAELKVMDLVWSRLKGFSPCPPWPSCIVQPSTSTSRPTKRGCKWVYFFGTNNYAWIENAHIMPYADYKAMFTSLSSNVHFKKAVVEIEEYVANLEKDPNYQLQLPDEHGTPMSKSEDDSEEKFNKLVIEEKFNKLVTMATKKTPKEPTISPSSSKKFKREEPSIPEKQYTPAKSLIEKVVQKSPSSLPIQNSSVPVDPNYYAFYYDPKRRTAETEDHHKKNLRKRKNPLSQNIPQRKNWSVEEAKRALEAEKDCNKRNRRQSLIIKFPDLELNRHIVADFHESIDSVHFQQPSTPRFCFVTLQDSADPETVIQHLNRIPFGQGYLTAEFKKDREDEINIGPEDIDPLTLYVGNLAQDVTKEDIVKAYPRLKRIDIGYAKKMKYILVSFKTVDDSIEAFQSTPATQMYSKSLIVRFRRLHGTVGIPGEPKLPHNHPKDTETPPYTIPPDEKQLLVKPEKDVGEDCEVMGRLSQPPIACALLKLKVLLAKLEKDVGEDCEVTERLSQPPDAFALPKPIMAVKTDIDWGDDAQASQFLPKPIGSRLEEEMKKEEDFPMPMSVKNETLRNNTATEKTMEGPGQEDDMNDGVDSSGDDEFKSLIFEGAKEIPQKLLDQLSEAVHMVEKFLQNTKYVAGDQMTIADFSFVTSVTSWEPYVPLTEAQFPKIMAWLKRMQELPYYSENQIGLDQLLQVLKEKMPK